MRTDVHDLIKELQRKRSVAGCKAWSEQHREHIQATWTDAEKEMGRQTYASKVKALKRQG